MYKKNILFLYMHSQFQIHFSRKEILILILSLVTSLFYYSQTLADTSDFVVPIIILQWEEIVYLDVWEEFKDPWALAYDNRDGFISEHVIIKGSVDTRKVWEYLLIYNVQDSSGNISESIMRRIIVREKLEKKKPRILDYEVKQLSNEELKILFSADDYTQSAIIYGKIWEKLNTVNGVERSFDYKNHEQTITWLQLWETYKFIAYVRNRDKEHDYVKWQFTMQVYEWLSEDEDNKPGDSGSFYFTTLPDSYKDLESKNTLNSLWKDETLWITQDFVKENQNWLKLWIPSRKRLSIWKSPDGKTSLVHTVKKPQEIQPVGINLKSIFRQPYSDKGHVVEFDFYSTGYSWYPGKVLQLEWGRGWRGNGHFRRGTEHGEAWWWVNLMRPTTGNKNYFRAFGSHLDHPTDYGEVFTGDRTPYEINAWNKIALGVYYKKGSKTEGRYFIYINGKKHLETDFLHLPSEKWQTLGDIKSIHVYLRLMDGGTPSKMIEWASYIEYFRNMDFKSIN